jgi:hypothetical protein
MELSADAVLALAPDDASAKAARGLTAPAKWPTLGANDVAVWGECQGSGAKPYQTQVDLAGPAFRCSCPSRKFPCKHGLALLLIRASSPSLFAPSQAPAWVQEWIDSRKEKQERKEQRAVEKASAPPPSPETLEKREAQRWKQIEGGLAHLQLWMTDQVQQGLANLAGEQRASFAAVAARLVDAQAPGLAQRLRDAGDTIGAADNWPARVLQCFGQLQLAIEAVQRRASLDAASLADLRVALGWPIDKEDVLATGERVEDDWVVLAVTSEARDGKLVERRAWLQGRASGRRALLLDFAFGGAGFETSWVAGMQHRMVLAFFPGAMPLRAVVAQPGEARSAALGMPRASADEWDRMARHRAASPWLPLVPMVFDAAVPLAEETGWWLRAGDGALPLRVADEAAWLLAAYSGGHPVSLFGEWDGDKLHPLTAWGPGSLWLNGAAA